MCVVGDECHLITPPQPVCRSDNEYKLMSVSPLSPKFPTVALQASKSSASLHGGGRIETLGTCTFNIHSIYLSNYGVFSAMLRAAPARCACCPITWRAYAFAAAVKTELSWRLAALTERSTSTVHSSSIPAYAFWISTREDLRTFSSPWTVGALLL